jgi:hypothetical protein
LAKRTQFLVIISMVYERVISRCNDLEITMAGCGGVGRCQTGEKILKFTASASV